MAMCGKLKSSWYRIVTMKAKSYSTLPCVGHLWTVTSNKVERGVVVYVRALHSFVE